MNRLFFFSPLFPSSLHSNNYLQQIDNSVCVSMEAEIMAVSDLVNTRLAFSPAAHSHLSKCRTVNKQKANSRQFCSYSSLWQQICLKGLLYRIHHPLSLDPQYRKRETSIIYKCYVSNYGIWSIKKMIPTYFLCVHYLKQGQCRNRLNTLRAGFKVDLIFRSNNTDVPLFRIQFQASKTRRFVKLGVKQTHKKKIRLLFL